MECCFEDLITQRFPPFVQPIVREGLEYVKQNATVIAKKGAEQIISLHPTSHADKLTNFTKFADFIGTTSDKTTASDIMEAIGEHWDKFNPDCGNPLSDIGTYSE